MSNSGAYKWLEGIFGLAPENLKLFRQAIGLVVIAQYINFAPFLHLFTSEGGAGSDKFLWWMSNSETVLASNSMAMWPFFRLLESSTTKIAVYGLCFLPAISLLLGRRTRLSYFLTWVGFRSIQALTWPLQNGGSFLIGTLLFWAIFLPDEDTAEFQETCNQSPLLNIATIALIAETLIFYTEAGIGKINPDWLNSSVLEDMITALLFISPAIFDLAWIWRALPEISVTVPVFELMVPLIFVASFRSHHLRLGLIIATIIFHLGLFVATKMTLFQVQMLPLLLLWLPQPTAKKILEKLSIRTKAIDLNVKTQMKHQPRFIAVGLTLICTFFFLLSSHHHLRWIKMKASTGYHSLKNLPVDSSLPHVEETSKSSQRSLTEHLHANKENPSFLTQSRAFRTTLLESVFLLKNYRMFDRAWPETQKSIEVPLLIIDTQDGGTYELFSDQPIFKDKKKACGLLPIIYPNLSISQVNIIRLLLDQQITIVSSSKRESMEQVFLDLAKNNKRATGSVNDIKVHYCSRMRPQSKNSR